MSWEDNITFDEQYHLLYKGVNLGLSREFIHDLNTGVGLIGINYQKIIEDLYNSKIQTIRDRKINQILND
jgi:hypothetical protein